MTISYSLDVSKARFGGFTKLLIRWRGSIYKILWREFLIFCLAYAILSVTYRCVLNEHQREIFERVVIFVATFSDLIPLSFVLGFYVSLVVTRWWNQYQAIPAPDRVCLMIASYVHGSDERSRKIRRTLGRYLILTQALTFQTVSTAVKRRFPTTWHLVAAGIMTTEEHSVFQKTSFQYGKWWLPCQWFTALATRAKKEGRIDDSIFLDALFREVLNFRNNCAIMIGYDWISVPLVYTQVVTIATYSYCLSLLIGRQYVHPLKNQDSTHIDLYIPIFTLLQFFFYVGWLKVAEQIINPYGEDDDDFELNRSLDRTVNVTYMIVDHLHMKHPKVKEDAFWNDVEIRLPHTKESAKNMKHLQLGSTVRLHINEAEYIPMDELFEEDNEENECKNDSLRRKSIDPQNIPFIKRVRSRIAQSFRRKSKKPPTVSRSLSTKQGCSNPAFSGEHEDNGGGTCRSTYPKSRRCGFEKLVKRVNSTGTQNSAKFKESWQKTLQEIEEGQIPNGRTAGSISKIQEATLVSRTLSVPAMTIHTNFYERNESHEDDFLANLEEHNSDILMPPIPEEASRSSSLASSELIAAVQRGEKASQQTCEVHDLVKEDNKVLQELSKPMPAQVLLASFKDNEGKRYETCCSYSFRKDTSGDSSEDFEKVMEDDKRKKDVFLVIEDDTEVTKDAEKPL